jgi:hypothetical protein
MGKVPVMNKATMSKRATLALSTMAAKVEKSDSKIPSEESIEAIEDVLSMVNNMEMFGTETRSYKYPNDPLTGAFYTVPVKYEFNDAVIRSKAQKVLRTTCGAHCGIPYPPVVRECIKQLVDRVKKRHPDNFVRVMVDTDNMVFKVARKPPKDADDPSWQYRQGDIPIPDIALDLSLRRAPRGFKLDIPDSPSKRTPSKSTPRKKTPLGIIRCHPALPPRLRSWRSARPTNPAISVMAAFEKPQSLIARLVLLFVLLVLHTCNNMIRNPDTCKFQGLTLSCINCNSLNMSSAGKYNQFHKIYGITKLRSDIILLADTRLCNKNLVSAEDDIKRLLTNSPYGQYNAWFNSTKNKRGVGILILKKLSVSVLRVKADRAENYLLLELEMSGERIIIGSIYGPNTLDVNFFENLDNDIRDFNNPNIIIGGDFNCTYSTDEIRTNIDCLNMNNPPTVHTHCSLVVSVKDYSSRIRSG